jgi:hypothetical protein
MEKFLTLTPCLPRQGGGRSACSPDAGAQRRNPGNTGVFRVSRGSRIPLRFIRATTRIRNDRTLPRSPDEGAQRRNPGTYYETPDFASLHPGYILSASRRGRGNNVIEAGA